VTIGYFLLISNQNSGYTQIKVYEQGYVIGVQSQKIGNYLYFFGYFPTTINYGITNQGYLTIWREDVSPATDFPLTANIIQNYYGMTFKITEVQPEYCILVAKSNQSLP